MKIEFIKMKFKIALAILVVIFCANIANAQNTLNNIGLSSSTPASVAYSLRLLSNSYAGPLVRVKVGASFYDVYPDASTKKFSLSSKISAAISTYNAAVSAAGANDLSSIISAGSTNATIAIWYDQSGNAIHVLSSSSSANIITAGTINTLYGQPTIYFSGSTSLLTSSSIVDYSAQSGATVNVVAQNVATTSAVGGIFGAANAIAAPGYNISYGGTGSGYLSDGAGCEYKTSFSSTNPQIVTNIFTNTTTNLSNTYINGALKSNSGSTCSLTHTSGSKIYIGSARGYGPFSFVGNISEAIIFPKQLVDAERNPLETNQTTTYFAPGVSITSSATSNTSCSGTSVTFTANIYNFTSTPTYQWTKNGIAIPGANSSTYSTSSLSNNDQIYVTAALDASTATLITSNLITNLDAGNASSYGGTGTTWTDLTGNGNKITLSGTGYSNVNGGGITFGTSKYGTQTLTSPPFNGDFTWSTILKAPDYNTNSWDFLYNVGGYTGLNIALVTGKPHVSWGTWFSDNINVNSEPIMTIGNYYMLTFVRSGNAISFYLQAAPYGIPSTVSGTIPSASPLVAKGPGSEWWENGLMNVMLLYNRALSQSEITQNYNSYVTRFGLAAAGVTSNIITNTIVPPTPIITLIGDGCINKTTLTTNSGLTAYAWYKDDVVISGATSNTFTPTSSGSYKVQVTSGSCANTSTVTTIYTCVKTSEGKMLPITASTTMVTTSGEINSKYGVDERGLMLTKPFANTPTGTNPVTTGLILYLDATRSASYGGSGTTWADISGQIPAGSATLVGNPTFGSGSTANGSGSFTFGSNINALTSKTYTIDNEITYIAWVNPSQTFDGGVIVRRTDPGFASGATSLYLYNNNLGYDWDNQNWGWRSNLTVPNDQWSMIVISVNAGSVTAYLCNASGINSVSSGRGHSSLTSKGATNFHIGYDPYNTSGRAFKGKMGTAMVYSTALSSSDIASIFNAQKAAFGL